MVASAIGRNEEMHLIRPDIPTTPQTLSLDSAKLVVQGTAITAELINSFLTKEDLKALQAIPTFEHKCNNCGGTVEMDIDNHIFRCPYCGSVYAVGIQQING